LARLPISGLYVIVDPDACRGRGPVEVARLALEGGASMIQWRDKRREYAAHISDARAILELCRDHGALFIVNDYVEMALELEADGVHVGQDDAPVDEMRRTAPALIIGASTNTVEEARRAEASGAAYVAVGSIFPTSSKDVIRPASLGGLREVKAAVRVPVVAIGGIDASNIDTVIEAGADAVAVISAVCTAEDPRAGARLLASRFNR
jgi:thiamine-phosphate diphosphorylase